METSTFADGFGRRFQSEPSAGAPLEFLRFCDEFSKSPSTEAALIERASRLDGFQHPAFGAVRRIERQGGSSGSLLLVSDARPGRRLAEILRAAERQGTDPDPSFALSVLQQVVAAVAALHEQGRDIAHGALGPERIIVGDDGRVGVAEHVLAPAIERMGLARTRLWTQFRVPVPPVAGTARFDQLNDVLQLGVLALALATGRLLGREDFPGRLRDLLGEVSRTSLLRERPFVSPGLQVWLSRALGLDGRTAFRSAVEANRGLIAALAPDNRARPSAAVPIISGFRNEQPPNPVATEQPPAALKPRRPATALAGRRSSWSSGGRLLRVSAVVLGLVTLWGAGYLGARSYLGFPPLLFRTGVLVVDSRPSGLEVLVDGARQGVTPATLELPPGSHTLALRSRGATTLVPVTVTAGQRRLERIEMRRGGRPPRRVSTVLPDPRPSQTGRTMSQGSR